MNLLLEDLEPDDKIKCDMCNGYGWYSDHSLRHYHTGNSETCDEAGCPVQVECEKCGGTGWL